MAKCSQCKHWSRDDKGARPWGNKGGYCSILGLTTHADHVCKDFNKKGRRK